jgi:predicted AAA+ superfamily ATPase
VKWPYRAAAEPFRDVVDYPLSTVIFSTMIERAVGRRLSTALEDTPAVFVAGARQTGKSTLVQAQARRAVGWTYRTLDDLATLASADADPEGFVEALGDRAILDEVQRAPALFLPIKAAIDRDRRPGRFLLTGSANVLALPKVAESLAGRMEVLTLWPFTQAELQGTPQSFIDACFMGHPDRLRVAAARREELVARMLRGGYPEAVARRSDDSRDRWFDAYVTTLLRRDVRELAAIERIAELPRLLQTIAARTGGPLNVADLGRTLGLNQMTLRRYLTLLETLYLVVLIPPWFENLGKRLARTPKPYVNDSGLLAHLTGTDAGGLSARPADLGPLAETFAVMELVKMAAGSVARPKVFHFRTSTGQEVDVVLENRRRELVGVEIKAGATISEADFKGLRALQELVGARLKCGVVLHAGREILPFGPRLWAAPIQALWGVALSFN